MTHEKKEMTNEEAVRYMEGLQRLFTQYRPIFSGNMVKANGKAIEALEKQIPKKPIEVDSNSGESYYRCPTCGEIQWDYEGFTFEYPSCRCGQRLNWNLNWSGE